MIRLVTPDAELLGAALAGDTALAAALGVPVAPGWAEFRVALESVHDSLAAEPDRAQWGPRLFIAVEPAELVGWGGFKGAPRDGVAELGYEIAEVRRGRGLATAAAGAMVAEALADPEVDVVIAHTLAERNASNRVLEKLGFYFDGETTEGETPVWRFTLRRPAPRS